jgi:hypothetical protein
MYVYFLKFSECVCNAQFVSLDKMTRLQCVVHVTQSGECFSGLLEEMVTGHSLPLFFVQNYRGVHLLFENVNMKLL